MTEKKMSSRDYLQLAMDAVTADNNLIRMQFQMQPNDDQLTFLKTLWPAVFDHSAWYHVGTKRPPPKKPDEDDQAAGGGGFGFGWAAGQYGSDITIRTFENDVWTADGRELICDITTEYGESTFEFKVKW